MARKVQSTTLGTRSARLKLEHSKAPYRLTIERGLTLVYYRSKKRGSWAAQFYIDGKRLEIKLGQADDFQDSNGVDILTFGDAQTKAKEERDKTIKQAEGIELECPKDFTVDDAIDLYLDDRAHLKSLTDIKRRLENNVSPTLGDVPLYRLTEKTIREWHKSLAAKPAKARPKNDGTQNIRKRQDPRARKVSANRVLSYFKAALNLAYENRKVASNRSWVHVKPFKEVEQAKIEYFTHDESQRLLNACEPDFRDLVRAALLTGARHSELCALKVKDYDPQNSSIFISKAKSSKARHIPLNDEGKRLFDRLSLGQKPNDRMLARSDSQSWEGGHQSRRMQQACKRASIEPFKGFHVLRHTYASELVSRGVPLQFVSELLGHSDTTITAKHYAHLQPSALQDAVKQFLPDYGTPDDEKVAQIRK